MYISTAPIEIAIKKLDRVHMFWGTSFLALKQMGLTVGKPESVDIAKQETLILETFYNPHPESRFYYVPLRGTGRKNRWVGKEKYSTSGLQTLRTQTFKNAFLHPTTKPQNKWAWTTDYIKKLENFIEQKQRNIRVPILYLAAWMFREKDWPPAATPEDIIQAFLTEFSITSEEARTLFDVSVPEELNRELFFQDEKVSLDELTRVIGKPDDASPEEGGTLAHLETFGIGPASHLVFKPANRLNLITGDNGLGKTFLLECAWWALTSQWAGGLPAYPRHGTKEAKINFQILGETGIGGRTEIVYDWQSQKWQSAPKRPTIPGLLVYARVDGSFAIWDPTTMRPFVFNREHVWDGHGKSINGLIYDWARWQDKSDKRPFETLKQVLGRLSPPSQSDLGKLEPGRLVRIPDDSREIPTIRHPYGEVPIVYASAGVRRIITIAYLIVWTWEEHKVRSELKHKSPERRMVILVDEMEAHLHPQWQRVILPALMKIQEDLASDLRIQLIVSTHSPLVTASVEPIFNTQEDKVFHLDLAASTLFGNEVELREEEFIKYGLVNNWLMSDMFELRHARSLEAEQAIEAAKALQLQENPSKEIVEAVSRQLIKYLSAEDEFWPRWKYFAEQRGIEL
jgi:hypothetical protein